MADRRFNLFLAAVFIGGTLPVQHGYEPPGIALDPTFPVNLHNCIHGGPPPRLRGQKLFPGSDKFPSQKG